VSMCYATLHCVWHGVVISVVTLYYGDIGVVSM
jgi:hypothetical protein